MPIKERNRGGLLTGIISIPGVGKTLMAGAWMKVLFEETGRKSLYRDWENGEQSIPRFLDHCFDLWQPDLDKDPIDEAMESVQLGLSGGYAGVVDDTISSMGGLFLRSVVGKQIFDKGSNRGSVKTAGGRQIHVASQSDYGHAQMLFEQWCMANAALYPKGIHQLWVGHEKLVDIKDANGAATDIIGGPEIIGSALTRTAPKLPHVFLRLKAVRNPDGTSGRKVQTDVDGYWIAKDRLRVLDPRGVDITVRGARDGDDLARKAVDLYATIWRAVFRAGTVSAPEV